MRRRVLDALLWGAWGVCVLACACALVALTTPHDVRVMSRRRLRGDAKLGRGSGSSDRARGAQARPSWRERSDFGVYTRARPNPSIAERTFPGTVP